MSRIDEIDNLKHLGMLRQEPKYITVEYKQGVYMPRFMEGIKSMWCGDEKLWQNPDYDKGGCFNE